ncbi:hypothetical protein [Microbulbifer sp. A4B17]|uniref:hypothetical protein n=1 Tax=Microbulbifer sp. A4B17 TaxID=359370 RepID=UPI001300558A|nr:hypothetical protein [Microbulbifer sp. A4B17]
MIQSANQLPGFYACVDYIWAKREDRIQRLSNKNSIENFKPPGFKSHWGIGKDIFGWAIYSSDGEFMQRITKLNDTQKSFPYRARIDDTILAKRVDMQWTSDRSPFKPYEYV